jgi:hypothetical protein
VKESLIKDEPWEVTVACLGVLAMILAYLFTSGFLAPASIFLAVYFFQHASIRRRLTRLEALLDRADRDKPEGISGDEGGSRV